MESAVAADQMSPFPQNSFGHRVPQEKESPPKLNISSVEILFPGERDARTNFVERVTFDQPRRPIPFGKIIYEDLTALPGVITLELFGHYLEVFPRAFVIDRKEYPWKSESTVELSMTNKPGP